MDQHSGGTKLPPTGEEAQPPVVEHRPLPQDQDSDHAVLSWLEEGSSPPDQHGSRGDGVASDGGDTLELSRQHELWRAGSPGRALSGGELSDDEFLQLEPEGVRRVMPAPPRRRYRLRLPLILFLLTCASTFLVGATRWAPGYYLNPQVDGLISLRRMLISHWQEGLLYMAAVLAILLCHEMGHFVLTLRHHIRASLPYFLPLPITPIGTLGAVIGMDGLRANRRQIFDIGIAGPLAGLFVAVPLLWFGVLQLDLTRHQFGVYQLDMPLIVRWMAWWTDTPGLVGGGMIWQGQLNSLLMAGWVGLLVTGLNMLPVSQLDGGHVIYALFGRSSRWIARLFMLSAVSYIVVCGKYELSLMVGLILLIGTDHPPTSDDSVRLGFWRTLLAYASLAIPLLCIPPRLIVTA